MIRSLLGNQECQGLCAHLQTQLSPPATTAAAGTLPWDIFLSGLSSSLLAFSSSGTALYPYDG